MVYGSKPPRRIVSKKAYARSISRKAATASTGMALLAISLLAMLIAILLVGLLLYSTAGGVGNVMPWWLVLDMLLCTSLLGGGGVYMFYLGRRTIREAKEIQAGIPLTRANIGNLPVRESLVRASNEPVQELQTILLRAATSTDSTPSSQLVRAYQEPVLEEETALLQQEPQTPITITASAETELVEQRSGIAP